MVAGHVRGEIIDGPSEPGEPFSKVGLLAGCFLYDDFDTGAVGQLLLIVEDDDSILNSALKAHVELYRGVRVRLSSEVFPASSGI